MKQAYRPRITVRAPRVRPPSRAQQLTLLALEENNDRSTHECTVRRTGCYDELTRVDAELKRLAAEGAAARRHRSDLAAQIDGITQAITRRR